MSDVTAILSKLRLTRNDLNNLPSDEVEYIFTNLSYDEIDTLCGINSKFNNTCRKKSLWKFKIFYDYGISQPLRGKTLKDSSRLFSMFNMINIGKKWVNGMTYKELLEEADNRGKESLLYLNHLKNEYVEEVLRVVKGTHWFYVKPDSIKKILFNNSNMESTEEQRIKIAGILTREFGVISAAIAMRYYSYPNLPYSRLIEKIEYPNFSNYTGNKRKSIEDLYVAIDEMFDYIPYIMEFSHYDNQWNLCSIIYPKTQ